jgi:hypothetical protein
MNGSSSSDVISIKKKYIPVILLALVLIFVGVAQSILERQPGSNSRLNNTAPSPSPTKADLAPNRAVVNSPAIEVQNQLDDIREENCELSQELLLQSLEISRQADDLEWASDGLDNFDKVQELRSQAMRLMIQSQELSSDC